MNFNSMTVRARLAVGFGSLLAVLVLVTGIAVVKVQSIKAALLANGTEHSLIQRYAINFRGSTHDRAIAVRDVALSSSEADRAKELAAIDRLARFYADAAAPLKSLLKSSADAADIQPLYAAIQGIESRAVASTKEVITRVAAGDGEGARKVLWQDAKPQYEQWLAAINKLIDYEEARLQAKNKFALEEAQGFLAMMLALLGAALLGGALVAWRIASSVLRQLGAQPQALGEVARRVAQGDLSPVPGAGTAPTGSVLATLAAMQHSLSDVVGRVRQTSDAIAAGSVEIANGNADLSARTEQQASSLQQTAASMEQMNASVKNNAEAAGKATQLAGSASQAAERGGHVVGQVVSTMDDIAQSSRRISEIIGTIDGIAFQTNILALNAAVEAARAGEQGRGFAVVAGEVRNLAQRSAEAAREIKTLIGASVDKVDAGTRLVREAGTSMEDILAQVRSVNALIGEISAASREQANGIGEVSGAVAGLDRTTQQNASLVEHSASAAAGLKQQAERLAESVRVFQLREARA